tara:strand:+ start:194 stop:502 length:309 start_codon:yes stop_codon:yes gene_type:complete
MKRPFKMYGKSPMMKALIGKQGNLPVELQEKILASNSPMGMYDKAAPVKKDTGNESDIDKKQKTYENEWKKSAAYINLTKANAPKEVLDRAKNKWSGLNKNK